jgi:hypothetical protein
MSTKPLTPLRLLERPPHRRLAPVRAAPPPPWWTGAGLRRVWRQLRLPA